MLDLYFLRETLLYVEEQHEWLSYIQSTINEKEQKYKILHSILTTRITEELNKTVADEQSNESHEIIVKQECCDSDHEARCFKTGEESATFFCNFIQNNNHQDQADVPETSNNRTLTNQCILHETTSNCNRMTSDNMNWIGNEDVLSLVEAEQFNNEQIDVKQNNNSCNDEQVVVADVIHLNNSNQDLPSKVFHREKDVGMGMFNDISLKPAGNKTFLHKKLQLNYKSTKKHFFCLNCNKSFSSNSNLQTHIRTHTGEKPFKCSICYKSFAQTATLKRHIRIHTGEKPFKCLKCNKSFARKGTLHLHFQSHTGEKRHKCSICNKTFSTGANCREHYRIHTGEKPYKCSFCFNVYRHQGTLYRHMQKHAGEKLV